MLIRNPNLLLPRLGKIIDNLALDALPVRSEKGETVGNAKLLMNPQISGMQPGFFIDLAERSPETAFPFNKFALRKIPIRAAVIEQ